MDYIVAKEDKNRKVSEIDLIRDQDWLKNTFMLTDSAYSDSDEYADWIRTNRFYSTADIKIASTSPGMTMGVNPKPQFTRYADPRSPGKLRTRRPCIRNEIGANSPQGSAFGIHTLTPSGGVGLGLGHYYSEAFDDNAQNVFFKFGVPKYTSFLVWMAKAFDINKTVLANRGVIAATILQAINIVGKLLAIFTAPLLAMGAALTNAMIINTRFYNVKETMYLYWSSVETVLNSMIARKTMVPMLMKDYTMSLDTRMERTQSVDQGNYSDYGFVKDIEKMAGDTSTLGENEEPQVLDPDGFGYSFVKNLSLSMPGVISDKTGRISVYALALKYQVAYNKILLDEYQQHTKDEASLNQNQFGYQSIDPLSSTKGKLTHDGYFYNDKGIVKNMTRYMFMTAAKLLGQEGSSHIPSPGDNMTYSVTGESQHPDHIEYDSMFLGEDGEPLKVSLLSDSNEYEIDKGVIEHLAASERNRSFWNRMKEYTLAEISDGGMFAIFQVDSTGSVGESFTNSTADNPIEATFNSISAQARNATRNIKSLAEGIPLVSNFASFAADALGITASNLTWGLANPLLALAYGLEVKMPKVWESSSSSLPRASYSMRLISPYGNAYSQLFNIYLPLAMLMAAGLPRSTGKSSYTSPFVCQVFDRGRLNIQLGMIDSLNITRGTSTLAFTRAGGVNAVDVDFSVANLDDTLAVEIADAGLLSSATNMINLDYSGDNFTDYINSITGVDVYNQIMRIPAMRLKAAERWMAFSAAFVDPDPAAYASFTGNRILPKGMTSLLTRNNAFTWTQNQL